MLNDDYSHNETVVSIARHINFFRHIIDQSYKDYKVGILNYKEFWSWATSKTYYNYCDLANIQALKLRKYMLDKNDKEVYSILRLYKNQ